MTDQDPKTTSTNPEAPGAKDPQAGRRYIVGGVSLTRQEAEIMRDFDDDPEEARQKLTERILKGKATKEERRLLSTIVQMSNLTDNTKALGPASTRKTRAKIAAQEASHADQRGKLADKGLAKKMKASVERVYRESVSLALAQRRVKVMLWSRQVPMIPAKEQCRRLQISMKQWSNDMAFIRGSLEELSAYQGVSEETRKLKELVAMESEIATAEALREATDDTKQKLAWTREVRHLRKQFQEFLFNVGKIKRVAQKIEVSTDEEMDQAHQLYQDKLARKFNKQAEEAATRAVRENGSLLQGQS